MKIPLIVIIGRPNVGKSTLFNRLVGKRDSIVDDLSGVTRDRVYGESDWNGKNFKVIDTGGYVPESEDIFETAIREQVEIAIEEADAILFIVDVRDGINPMDKDIMNSLFLYWLIRQIIQNLMLTQLNFINLELKKSILYLL